MTLVSVTLAALVIALLLWVLRKGAMREKYAALWLVVGVAIVVLALWPGLLASMAQLLGFQVGSNLLFFLGILLLLAVCLHLSLEVSALEDEARVLAEEVSMLWLALEERTGEVSMVPPRDADPADAEPPELEQ